MDKKKIKPSSGKLLISEPSLQDFYFRKSVILLIDYSIKGAFGLIINKPLNVKLNEITKDFLNFDGKLFLGGPVKTDNLFYIHTKGDEIKNSAKIMDGLYWGGDIKTIKNMILNNQITTNDIRFFVGYSGWGSKQLDRELELNSWIVVNTKVEHIINANPDKLWSNILKTLGKDYAIWANYPKDPILN